MKKIIFVTMMGLACLNVGAIEFLDMDRDAYPGLDKQGRPIVEKSTANFVVKNLNVMLGIPRKDEGYKRYEGKTSDGASCLVQIKEEYKEEDGKLKLYEVRAESSGVEAVLSFDGNLGDESSKGSVKHLYQIEREWAQVMERKCDNRSFCREFHQRVSVGGSSRPRGISANFLVKKLVSNAKITVEESIGLRGIKTQKKVECILNSDQY